jgi:hypothetical protein
MGIKEAKMENVNVKRIRRISYGDWYERVNMLMLFTLGTPAGFFRLWNWKSLYDAERTPGQAVDALYAELGPRLRNEFINA